jgi:hypothetical protein
VRCTALQLCPNVYCITFSRNTGENHPLPGRQFLIQGNVIFEDVLAQGLALDQRAGIRMIAFYLSPQFA